MAQRKFKDFYRFLQSPQGVKRQIPIFFWVVSGYERLKASYEQKYGRQLDGTSKIIRHEKPKSALGLEGQFEWREFPSRWALLSRLRTFSTVYMSYVVVRFFFSGQIDFLVRLFVNLDRPIHCYLMGRYVLHESVAELMGACFSIMFLIWRALQSTGKPYRYSLAHFLVHSEHDRALVHDRLLRGLELSGWNSSSLGPLERYHLDTMCYHVIYPHRVILRLRTNRTRAAFKLLSERLARTTCLIIALLVPLAVSLFVLHMILHMLDQRYLRIYPNCDPELERLNKAGQLGPWSMTLTGHHLAAVFFDELENLVLWIECGLVATIAPSLAYLYNYDLVLQWSGIRRKIEHNLELNRGNPAGYRWSRSSRDDTYELAAEVSDFFAQVKEANQALAQFLNVTVIGFLSLSALCTYILQTNFVHQIPATLTAVLMFITVALSVGCYFLIQVHRSCSSSYTTLCSLMAHLEARPSKSNIVPLLEFFAKNRDCYLLMGLYPFLPTTFLTIIGWTFSCICITTGILHQGESQDRFRALGGLNASMIA